MQIDNLVYDDVERTFNHDRSLSPYFEDSRVEVGEYERSIHHESNK